MNALWQHVCFQNSVFMENLAKVITQIITASDIKTTIQLALDALRNITNPKQAAILLWDEELERFIVGNTFIDNESVENAPLIRRQILQLAETIQLTSPNHVSQLGLNVFSQPLFTNQKLVGTFIGIDCQSPPQHHNQDYDMLIKVIARALSNIHQLEQADIIRQQLEADHERLKHLLKAVDQQQRTIDRLLSAERQFSAELEVKVEERTAALKNAQQQLLQSEKLAVIGKLASSLAHEINNPLQAIRSGLGLVMTEIKIPKNSATWQDLSTIQDELERIELIFRQMLDFNRPVTYNNMPLDINEICQSVQVLMRKRLIEANINLQMQLSKNLPQTCGDTNQIKQVILNLVLNAAEAMLSDSGTIILKTAKQNGYVCIATIDDGRGIKSDHLVQLFEPLFTTKMRGLGLGLAISQEIIQRHGGSIKVETTPQAGTTFEVLLPVRRYCSDS